LANVHDFLLVRLKILLVRLKILLGEVASWDVEESRESSP